MTQDFFLEQIIKKKDRKGKKFFNVRSSTYTNFGRILNRN